MSENTRTIVVFLLFGLVAGWLASFIVGGSGGLLSYLVSGVAGAFVGGYLMKAVGINLGIQNRLLSEMVTAVIGAVIVVLVVRVVF